MNISRGIIFKTNKREERRKGETRIETDCFKSLHVFVELRNKTEIDQLRVGGSSRIAQN